MSSNQTIYIIYYYKYSICCAWNIYHYNNKLAMFTLNQ